MGGPRDTPANVKLLLSPRQSRGITHFIFIKDAAYSIPNCNGDLIYMSGWKAGITLMIIALHEFTQFGPYSSTLPMEDYYKNVISLMLKLSHVDCSDGVACNIRNAATCLKVLMSIVDEMAWSEVYEVLD